MAESTTTKMEDNYIHRWEIPNWLTLQGNQDLMENQYFEFSLSDTDGFRTEWKVGLKVFDRHVRVYWKLTNAKGFNNNVKAKLRSEWCDSTGIPRVMNEDTAIFTIGQTVNDKEPNFFFGTNSGSNRYVTPNGSLIIIITTTVFRGRTKELINNDLSKYCSLARTSLSKSFAALLEDNTSSDLKIITSDAKEHFAHKLILKSRCEVFASMFRNEFTEAATGTVRIDDISESTMKVLLRYWYTGELLPCLFDEDAIVEFTYAAGKYQLKVLQILDEMTRYRDSKKVNSVDVQLLNLAEKLSLKNMEAHLQERITAQLSNVKQSQDLFTLFGWDEESLGSEELCVENVLHIFEDLIDETESSFEGSKMDILLLWQAQKFSLKKLESRLLKRISIMANKASNARDLIELMSPLGINQDSGEDLLVRVSK